MNLFMVRQQIIASSPFCLLGLLGLTLFASPLAAQVNGVGPSDSALFNTVINVPPEPNIGGNQSIGGVIGQTTQLNLIEGGRVGFSLRVNSGSEVNISGGSVSSIDARSGSEVNVNGGVVGDRSGASFGGQVNISGGIVGDDYSADSGSEVNISGGSVGMGFEAQPGSDVELIGGEFNLNGAAFTDATITLTGEDVFTGTLADGSVFSFSPRDSDELNEVTLTSAALPTLDTTPIVVNTPFPARPSGLRAGQTLTLQDGGQLRNFEAVGATLNIEGGDLFRTNSVIRSEVNISGGNVGTNFDGLNAFDSVVNISEGTISRLDTFDSVTNISGGDVDRFFANSGSQVNISGGIVDLVANSGSVVDISGGSLRFLFTAISGSQVSISGGSVGSSFRAVSGSDVELLGGEFKLNGAIFTDSTITLGEDDVLTGTLSDGSAFLFSSKATNEFGDGADELNGVTLTPTALPTLDTTPMVVNTSFPDRPSGLRAGQTLTLQEGGELGDNFEAIEATLNIDGGSLGAGAGVFQGEVNINGGTVDNSFTAHAGSEVNISGGNVGPVFLARSDSRVNISGGSVGSLFTANAGSEVNISGGTVAFGFRALAGSEVNLFGNDFAIDGVSIDGLAIGDTLTIVDRDVVLSGLLADGSEFGFRLVTRGFFEDGVFDPNATLTVTMVAADPEIILGDVNQDGVVDFLDISPFIGVLSAGEFQAEADCNQDGEVNFLDISPFITILSGE